MPNQRQLTELQTRFLDALFTEAKGTTHKLCGLLDTLRPQILMLLCNHCTEIIERAELEMAANAPKAVLSMVGVIDDPTAIGNREKLSASQQILDRVGLSR